MVSRQETVQRIVEAPDWNQRVAQIRLIPQMHGTGVHPDIFRDIALKLYLPHLAPDFAYVHEVPFYGLKYFAECYDAAHQATGGFTRVSTDDLAVAIRANPRALLPFRTILGLTRQEFAQSTKLAGSPAGLPPLTAGKVDSMERHGTSVSAQQARVAGLTISQIMDRSLFGEPPTGLISKQDKPDTQNGWNDVRSFAAAGVPLEVFLHQRHYGGAFRQVLDATSTQRGDILEDAVEAVFKERRIPFIRTGSHNQAEIASRFEVRVTPAPDFVVFDSAGALRAMLECKGTNDGGTARDKAFRFERLREESSRLGGIPLIAVLGGMGWTRLKDALGPVVRDTEGRVFTLATLESIVRVNPFPALIGTST